MIRLLGSCWGLGRRHQHNPAEAPQVQGASADTRKPSKASIETISGESMLSHLDVSPAPTSEPRKWSGIAITASDRDSSTSLATSSRRSSSSRQVARRRGVTTAPVTTEEQARHLLLGSMTWGVEKVAADYRQGLPKENIHQFITATEKRGYVFGHRPVPPLCRRPIEEGNPTKPFAVKGKSARDGFQNSFVCIDQRYSKIAGFVSEEEILKANKEVASIDPKVAVPGQLKISSKRVQELLALPGGWIERNKEFKDFNTGMHIITYTIYPRHGGEAYEEVITYNPVDGYWYVSLMHNNHMKPLDVLCHPEAGLPITADVDPLLEAYPWEKVDFAHEDKLPVPLISHKDVQKRLSVYEQRESKRQSTASIPDQREMERRRRISVTYEHLKKEIKIPRFLKNEDPIVGNVTPRVRGMISHYGKSRRSEINREHPLVHHNIDSTSPFSKEEDNYPATLYFPQSVVDKVPEFDRGVEPVVMVYNREQLKLILQLLKDNDQFMYINPLWGDLASIRSERFKKNSAQLERKLAPIYSRRRSAPQERISTTSSPSTIV